MSDIIVLKFGSSVLESAADLPRAVDEIYRHVRDGRRVVAVVSAFAGVTDRLIARAQEAGGRADAHAWAALVGSGETEAAAMLTLALAAHGLPARLLPPEQLSLAAQGDPLDAEPYDLDVAALHASLADAAVAVVPGFVAHDTGRRTVLLGRGGSDYTALFIAQRLAAPCTLLKDVDGLYERDPALPGPLPQRFATVTWDDALRVAGKLVQPKTIRFAHLCRQSFSVTRPGAAHATVVGPGPSRLETAARSEPLKVVLLGLGTVGRGVYERLAAAPRHFEVVRIVVRDPARHAASGVPAALLSQNPWAAVNEPADVVVETLGGESPAAEVLLAALLAGRRVVTANKAALAPHWNAFAPFATGHAPALLASAAAGGALPVLETLSRLARTDGVRAVRGVLNGTCNYILDRLADGAGFADALAEAQALGFAEPDPAADLSAADVEHKLRLCAAAAFGSAGLEVERAGIAGIDAAAASPPPGRRLRLIASLERDQHGVRARIGPAEVDAQSFLGATRGEDNRVEIECVDGQVLQLAGKGAGRWPTTTAVMGDLWHVLRRHESASTSSVEPLGNTG